MTAEVTSIVPQRAAARRRERKTHGTARIAIFFLVPVATLLIVGLGSILSSSSVVALRETGDSLFYFKRQLGWAAAGVLVLLVASRIPLRWYARLAFPVFLLAVVGLVAVLVAGEARYGATRWLAVGPISIQPSEFAKLATILLLATVVSRREQVAQGLGDLFWPVVIAVGVIGGLIMMQPDLGTTLLVGVGAFAILFASTAPLYSVLVSAGVATGVALALARSSPYRWVRITSFLDPLGDPLGSGFQATQSLVALGTGGWFGVGLGASRARWSFLPNAHTDFIFSILGEETGLTGSLAVVALFVAFTVAGTVVAYRASDRFGRLLAIGITVWLGVQALVNIGGVVGVLPVTGAPLPFVSFGGSALLTEMAAVGILVSVCRNGSRAAEAAT
ncbi:MAG: putative lipid II flippase FtsW [Acidimicrobiia bacterium]